MQHFYAVMGIQSASPPPPFFGSPNVTISAINTSGGIVASRTSGSTPCFIHVSASAITATGTGSPHEDLEYSWDFGDPGGTEIVVDYSTYPYTGVAFNLNTIQSGPEAAYCYRSAGTYTVTLNIRGNNGSGPPRTASVQSTVIVSSFSASGGDFFVDFAAAGGGSGSSGSPFNSITQVNSAIANNTRFNFKRGSSIIGATGIDMSGKTLSHVHFQDYGSGALPVITVNGANTGFFTNNGGATGHPQDDIVISNISFQTASGFNPPNGNVVGTTQGNATAAISNFYIDNCIISNSVDPSTNSVNAVDFGGDSTTPVNFGVWNCTVTSPLQATVTNHCRQGIYGGVKDWFFVIGCSISGSGSDAIHDHHIYCHTQTHGCFQFNKFGLSATVGNTATKNFCIKLSLNLGEGDGGFYAQYFNLSRNYMSGTQSAHDASEANNDPTQTRMKNYVSQRNAMTGFTQDGNILPYNGETMTVRDNNVWNCLQTWWSPKPKLGTTTYLKAQLYRNKIYKTDGVFVFDYTGIVWTTKQVITDNVIFGTNVSPNLNDIIFTDQSTALSLIDRNKYWAPNAGNYLFSNASSVSLATWRAGGWDANGSNANPNWPNPANGNFG